MVRLQRQNFGNTKYNALIPLFLIVAQILFMPICRSQEVKIPLGSLIPISATQSWGTLQYNRSVQGHPLRIGGQSFETGLGTHSASRIDYMLDRPAICFTASVGVDAEMAAYPKASVVFRVLGDGRLLFQSDVMHTFTPAAKINLALQGVRRLTLEVTDAGDGIDSDHADWADARIAFSQVPASIKLLPKYYVGSQFRAGIAADGTFCEVQLRGEKLPVRSDLLLVDTPFDGVATVRQVGKGLAIERRLKRGAVWRQTFEPLGEGFRISVTVLSAAAAWGDIITARFQVDPTGMAVWCPGASELPNETWRDPLETRKFERRQLSYGTYFGWQEGVCLPLVSLFQSRTNFGFTISTGPLPNLLDLDIAETGDGMVAFTHRFHRFGNGCDATFQFDFMSHAANVRSALASYITSHRAYFEPVAPNINLLYGHGAYSGSEAIPATKYAATAFCFNWKASLDFPYMGLFLPPVGHEDHWNKFAGGGSGIYTELDEGRFGATSIAELSAYSGKMRAAGYHVLNYFNVTEFGGNITDIAPHGLNSQPDWKDPNYFIHSRFESAILRDPVINGTWGGAAVMDCGDPDYRSFLLDQARRHLIEIPASDGLCIDRLDWLMHRNPHADDGRTWDNGPARSLYSSWHGIMNELGPIMHQAGKSIFVNALIHRIDLMDQVDGIYDEFGHLGKCINNSALLCPIKPLTGWTPDFTVFEPAPDRYMQRYLYLGAFMTAPMPNNDHTINPSMVATRLYDDYGPLFCALHNRRWDLQTEFQVDAQAKANLFSTPNGKIMSICFAPPKSAIRVRLRVKACSKVEYVTPGATWKRLRFRSRGGSVELSVPTDRGCAMVRFD